MSLNDSIATLGSYQLFPSFLGGKYKGLFLTRPGNYTTYLGHTSRAQVERERERTLFSLTHTLLLASETLTFSETPTSKTIPSQPSLWAHLPLLTP